MLSDNWWFQYEIIFIALIASIASVIFTFVFLIRTVVKPIQYLTSVAETQVAGDLSARAQINSDDEVGKLGRIFNQLTDELVQSINKQKYINLELENRVQERTSKLQHELDMREIIENEMNLAKISAENANMSKTRFLASASHDLRQPVNAMGLILDTLLSNTDSNSESDQVV
ncbi:MAG: HAMP domain-containing protein [Gammaproteobacteria bacterium]|nr:HAMP domain-containing protein [Gammaproteobacteria bacterium]